MGNLKSAAFEAELEKASAFSTDVNRVLASVYEKWSPE
jgi:hypothetical protein